MSAERDSLVTKASRLAEDRNSLSETNRELVTERDNYVTEVDRLAAEQRSSAEAHRVLMAERQNLVAANDRLIAAQNAILTSQSWKVTSPLRFLRKLLFGEKK